MDFVHPFYSMNPPPHPPKQRKKATHQGFVCFCGEPLPDQSASYPHHVPYSARITFYEPLAGFYHPSRKAQDYAIACSMSKAPKGDEGAPDTAAACGGVWWLPSLGRGGGVDGDNQKLEVCWAAAGGGGGGGGGGRSRFMGCVFCGLAPPPSLRDQIRKVRLSLQTNPNH